MTFFEVTPLKQPITANIEIPGSKSYTNRALILAALTHGPVTLHHPLYCEDTMALIACLRTLGLRIETLSDQMTIYDDLFNIQDHSYELFAKDSGTTLRFLLAVLCLVPGIKILKGNARLNERPIRELVDALRELGAEIEFLEKEGHSPLKIHSSSLKSVHEVVIDASMSSQFVSALLMIAPFLNNLKIRLQGGELISKPYVDMTIHIMNEWGVNVLLNEKGCYVILGEQHYKKKHYTVEGDFSSAGYFLALAALTQSTLHLKNLNPLSAQADRKFLTILARMGNEVHYGEREICIRGKRVVPLTLDMEDCPDQVQTMAVLASFAQGVTKISGVRSLRLKETERVLALKNELKKMGITTEDTHDTLTIYGGNPRGATVNTYGDHRMAMAFAVAGAKIGGMTICNPEVVNKTFPKFWDNLMHLTGSQLRA